MNKSLTLATLSIVLNATFLNGMLAGRGRNGQTRQAEMQRQHSTQRFEERMNAVPTARHEQRHPRVSTIYNGSKVVAATMAALVLFAPTVSALSAGKPLPIGFKSHRVGHDSTMRGFVDNNSRLCEDARINNTDECSLCSAPITRSSISQGILSCTSAGPSCEH